MTDDERTNSEEKANADRYRFLRDNCVKINPGTRDGPEHKELRFTGSVYEDWRFAVDHIGLDAAIDQAIAGSSGA